MSKQDTPQPHTHSPGYGVTGKFPAPQPARKTKKGSK